MRGDKGKYFVGGRGLQRGGFFDSIPFCLVWKCRLRNYDLLQCTSQHTVPPCAEALRNLIIREGCSILYKLLTLTLVLQDFFSRWNLDSTCGLLQSSGRHPAWAFSNRLAMV